MNEIENSIEIINKDIWRFKNLIVEQPNSPVRDRIESEIFAYETAISALTTQLNNRWIPVSERLPENENPVEVTARRKEGAKGYFIYKAHYIAPHTKTTEDYGWEESNVDCEYDKENDCYWVPECWYEDNAIEENGNWILNDEFDILAWKPLPTPYKEEDQ
jgi:hypothetical protein